MIHPNATLPWAQIYGINSRTGDIGVELEIEGENLPQGDIESWVVKTEGSLRGRAGRQVPPGEADSPYEYVLGRPSMFKTLERKLQRLEEALTGPDRQVRLTDRGSTHLHINMTERTIREIIGFLVIFTSIEPVLLRYCGPTRNGNLFCLPSYETGDWADTVERMVMGTLGHRLRDYWPNRRGKYSCLNTDTLTSFGSLEVRCFPNCISAKTINTWAEWLMNIRTLAMEWEEPTYHSLLDRAYERPNWLLQKVFDTEPLLACCHPNAPEELVRFGIEHAYEIAKTAHPMLEWTEQTKPKKKSKGWDTHKINTLDLGWAEERPPELPPDLFDDEVDPR